MDLVASGYHMCRQMDQRPTKEASTADLESPDGGLFEVTIDESDE